MISCASTTIIVHPDIMHVSFTLILVLLVVLYCDAKEETLLDDSEYKNLLQFDDMLSNLATEMNNTSSSDGLGTTLNYVNIAMLYHQRNVRWKQGGAAESLHYIDLALQSQSSEVDQAHKDYKLQRSMLLHKAVMLTSLGQRDAALSVFDILLAVRSPNPKATSAGSLFNGWDTGLAESMSDQEMSTILYHKAELLLTLSNDFSAAISLFKQAVALYPCNYRSYLQLVQAMKATKQATQEEWLDLIEEMEKHLLNIKQHPSNTKMKYKYKPPPIEYRVPFRIPSSIPTPVTPDGTTHTVLSDTHLSMQSVLESVYYYSIRTTISPTEHICTFSRTDNGETGLYGTATATASSTGYSQTDTILYGIYASINWALFTAADTLTGTGDPKVDTHYRNVAWKYLQQARHFDRQSINEQHLYMDYQLRIQNDENDVHSGIDTEMLPEGVNMDNIHTADKNSDFIPTIDSPNLKGDTVYASTATLGETAVRKTLEHSDTQVKHLTSFFKKGYWGHSEHYANYTVPPASLQNLTHNVSNGSTGSIGTQIPTDESGRKTRIPIFIVGFFRSGSTLLESLLEEHSGFVHIHTIDTNNKTTKATGTDTCVTSTNSIGTTECQQVAKLGYQLHSVWGMGENSPFVFDMYAMQEETLTAFDTLEKERTVLQNKYAKKKSSKKREQEENKLEDAFMQRYNTIIDSKATTIVGKMQKAFVDMHSYANINSSIVQPTHIVDKMLANYVNIGLIHMVFPRAIILHTIRDPMDTLYSCYSTRFGDPAAVFTLYADTLVQKYVQYLEVMQHFRKVLPYYTLPHWNLHHDSDNTCCTQSTATPSIDSADNKGASGTKDKVQKRKRIQALVDVRYEELVANPERVIRYLLNDILGIPYIPSHNPIDTNTVNTSGTNTCSVSNTATMLPSTYTRVVQTASRLQVKQPIYASSVGRWRKYHHQLQHALIPTWKQQLPYLASINALPYAAPEFLSGTKQAKKKEKCKIAAEDGRKKKECVFMNWNCTEHFDYTQMLVDLQ